MLKVANNSPRFHRAPTRALVVVAICALELLAVGCTSPREWVANGFKVGPNYRPPTVPLAEDWIDADDRRVADTPVEHCWWWTQFDDPVLNELVAEAYRQNLTVREAGARILEARMLRAIAAGNVLPQDQQVAGGYSINRNTLNGTSTQFHLWNGAFSYAWELDFWGRFRRAVAAADADLEASVFDYGDVVVTLIADVAATYVDIRTLQTRLALVKENVENQRRTYQLTEDKFIEGATSDIDVQQARSSLLQTQAFVPQLEIALRQSQNQLCVLLGIPVVDLAERLGEGKIPTASPNIAMGIPARTLMRRPDVRRAERQLAAQSELIGIAEADLYPHITLSGEVGGSIRRVEDLFTDTASFASSGPSFRWDILNYGRIVANVGVQEARFQQLLASYRQSVLLANLEAENALIEFLKSQERLELQLEAAEAAGITNELIQLQLAEGDVDINRVFNIQNFKTQQEESAAQARGDVAQSLISIYRAVGGGWPARGLGEPIPVAPDADADAEEVEGVETPAEELLAEPPTLEEELELPQGISPEE